MKNSILCTLLILLLSECATIMNGQSSTVTIASRSSQKYNLQVVNQKGLTVYDAKSPATLELKNGNWYAQPSRYVIYYDKDGNGGFEIVRSSLSGWYFGNLIFGGLIGMIAVDPVTGAMYSYDDTILLP